jgi:microcompartment protein CcmL/EutN
MADQAGKSPRKRLPSATAARARVPASSSGVVALREPLPGPALALLEVGSVARGMVVADVAVKKAKVQLVVAEAVTPGKFLVVLAGGEEEVAQSLAAGLEAAAGTLIDRVHLPQADAQILPAMRGQPRPGSVEALAIVETFSVAAAVLAADRAVKAAEVRLLRLRLARGLGGKAHFVLTGPLHQIEAAAEAARTIIHDGMLLAIELIPRPHPDFVDTLL